MAEDHIFSAGYMARPHRSGHVIGWRPAMLAEPSLHTLDLRCGIANRVKREAL